MEVNGEEKEYTIDELLLKNGIKVLTCSEHEGIIAAFSHYALQTTSQLKETHKKEIIGMMAMFNGKVQEVANLEAKIKQLVDLNYNLTEHLLKIKDVVNKI